MSWKVPIESLNVEILPPENWLTFLMKSASPSRRDWPSFAIVFADANVLFSRVLRDYVLYSAHFGAIQVHWSQMVLDEMSRNLRKRINATTQDTRRLEALMNDFLPEALVQDARFDIKLPETVSVHPKDRHVLQAALCVNANIIVTDNLKDFPADWMRKQGILLVDSAAFISMLVMQFPTQFKQAHELCVELSGSQSEAKVLQQLERATNANVVKQVRDLLRSVS